MHRAGSSDSSTTPIYAKKHPKTVFPPFSGAHIKHIFRYLTGVHQTTNLTGETIVIHGILYYMVKNRSKFDWTDEELTLNAENVFNYAPENVYLSCPVDVHYTTFVNSPTKIAAIVASDEQYPASPYN